MSRRCVVAGAGGFIGGHLAKSLIQEGHIVVAADKKPLERWYQQDLDCDKQVLDLRNPTACHYLCRNAHDVYQLAADMGGMGFIEKHRVDCMRSVLINVHMLKAATDAEIERYFYSSSACAYNLTKQQDQDAAPLTENDAYPAMPERGYGWEKLYSEILAQEYHAEYDLNVWIARFHNCYGTHGTWRGGREKAPAALCRKVAEAWYNSSDILPIWGDGSQARSYMWIDDCVEGIKRIIAEPRLVSTPINLGSAQSVTVNEMASMIERIAGVSLEWVYDTSQPRGVVARNSDNTFIKEMLNWEPSITINTGLNRLYPWIQEQVARSAEGKDVVE